MATLVSVKVAAHIKYVLSLLYDFAFLKFASILGYFISIAIIHPSTSLRRLSSISLKRILCAEQDNTLVLPDHQELPTETIDSRTWGTLHACVIPASLCSAAF
jgi:hypothetical protein